MNYDSRFLNYLVELLRVEGEDCGPLAVEAVEYSVEHQRYTDAALIVILASRRLPTQIARRRLVATLSELNSWESLQRVSFFAAWLADSRPKHDRNARIRHDDLEARWIETDAATDEGLFSACRELFADLASSPEEVTDSPD